MTSELSLWAQITGIVIGFVLAYLFLKLMGWLYREITSKTPNYENLTEEELNKMSQRS